MRGQDENEDNSGTGYEDGQYRFVFCNRNGSSKN